MQWWTIIRTFMSHFSISSLGCWCTVVISGHSVQRCRPKPAAALSSVFVSAARSCQPRGWGAPCVPIITSLYTPHRRLTAWGDKQGAAGDHASLLLSIHVRHMRGERYSVGWVQENTNTLLDLLQTIGCERWTMCLRFLTLYESEVKISWMTESEQ